MEILNSIQDFAQSNFLFFSMVVLFGIFDVITGLFKAVYTGTAWSKVTSKGIVKKLGFLTSVIIGYSLDWCILYGLSIDASYSIGACMVTWVCITELISIIENLAATDIPIPKFLSNLLLQTKQKVNGDDE